VIIHAWTDGASRGNPGESGIGVILKDERGGTLRSVCGYLGKATNNVAEYSALLACLKLASEQPCKMLIVHSDSELMVKQLNGLYKVKDANLKRYVQRVRERLSQASFQVTIKHVMREENREADELANRGIDTRTPLPADDLPLFRQ